MNFVRSDDVLHPEGDHLPRPKVFICRDHMCDPMLDRIAAELEQAGATVLRGPASQPGEILELPRERWDELIGDTSVAMFSSRWRCTRDLMISSRQLHGIVNPTIGLETVDLRAADELGIVVGHGATPENYVGMAEASIMLMLNLLYDLRGSEAVLKGQRPRPSIDGMSAHLLRDSTVGIVGLGRIGRTVMERLLAFGSQILVHSPSARQEQVPENVRLVDLDTLMKESDIVGVFVAVTPSNRAMINERTLSLMKSSAYLINVARGDAVDELALVRALQERRIAGAALDTFAVEPLPQESPLRSLPNVILTPHLVGHTREAYDSLPVAAVANIKRILRGELPLYCKNPSVLQKWLERRQSILPTAELTD